MDSHSGWLSTNGGFHKWGVPQSSSTALGFSLTKTIYFGVPMDFVGSKSCKNLPAAIRGYRPSRPGACPAEEAGRSKWSWFYPSWPRGSRPFAAGSWDQQATVERIEISELLGSTAWLFWKEVKNRKPLKSAVEDINLWVKQQASIGISMFIAVLSGYVAV